MNAPYSAVIDFWFKEIKPASWWVKDEIFDQVICDRFHDIYQQVVLGEYSSWRQDALGRLAEIIVLDQFPRNMFRDTAKAFQSDGMALILSQEAISLKADTGLEPSEKSFMYMPFMHSESLHIHTRAVELFERCGNESNLRFELKHKEIIERFGRYPHRNEILGRKSTPEELEFLTQAGSSF